MIDITRLLYKIDLKLNKLSSNDHQNIPVEDKILALNEAQIRLIKRKVNPNNIYQLGFDAFRQRYEDLQNLVVPYEELEVSKTQELYTSYQTDLTQTKQKYFLPIDIITKGNKGNCKDRTINVSFIVKHSDLSVMMNNSDFQPSFAYQETLSVISSNKLIVYTNDPKGDFEIDKVLLSYLRYPREMDAEGYIHFNDEESTNIDCELPEHLEDELLALTVLELGLDTNNPNGQQQTQISDS